MARYVGLDAHSKRCVYVIQDELGKVGGQGSVPTTEVGLHLWLLSEFRNHRGAELIGRT